MAYYNSYNPKLLEGVTHIHFIGCGGSGMYPLIQILHAKGYTMSGSDVEETKITQAEQDGKKDLPLHQREKSVRFHRHP